MSAGRCTGCGGCCDPVMVAQSRHEMAALWPGDLSAEDRANRDFVLHVLRPLPYAEGRRRAGWLPADASLRMLVTTDGSAAQPHFYECPRYDPETRACTDYDHRPPLCRGYPWYGGPPRGDAALPPDCGYWEDVPVPFRRRR